jgi:ribosomal protein S27E
MATHVPQMVYSSGDLAEVNALAIWLAGQGIDARVLGEDSAMGIEAALAFAPDLGFRGVQIWVQNPDDVARAVELIAAKRAELARRAEGRDEIILVTCEECGEETRFTGESAGSVQNCPHCQAFVDVPGGDDWDVGDAEADESQEPA